MKEPGRRSLVSRQNRLFSFLTAHFADAALANELFAEFLSHTAYSKDFCLKLLEMAQAEGRAPWEIRRLAVLMLEHQILMLDPDDAGEFDFLLTRLSLKQAPGLNVRINNSVLKEGYSTTDLRRFISELRRRLLRLNRVHLKIQGWRTTAAGLRDFVDLSRCDCKLSLARYLFTVDEVVAEILSQVQVTEGAKDLDTTQPLFVEAEAERALIGLPDFESAILRKLSASSSIYWVSEGTSPEINSLVEYPLTTVVLVIKPPGSDIELEFKRAGRKGPHSLGVVCIQDGCGVAPSHRLDGGNMQWLLRHEAKAAARLGLIFRLVHGVEAPMPNYIARSTIYSIPARDAPAQTLTYFTDSRVFGEGFGEMRQAMIESVAAFKTEGYAKLPDLPGELGVTAQFISIVSPAQAILKGTSSFRLDRLVAYLSADGPRRYFAEGLKTTYTKQDARRFADTILEEILGVYQPPDVRYESHEQYLAAAFAVPENRARADNVYLSLLSEIGRFSGTLLGVRGHSRGESFVARNVGLKSIWKDAEWNVQIVFMDHDSIIMPGLQETDFYAVEVIPGMILDETYIWGRPAGTLGSVGHLRAIFRVADSLYERGQIVARKALKKAYQKTQRGLASNEKLRVLFNPQFIARLLDWDLLVSGYLKVKPETAAASRWKEKMRERFREEKGYETSEVDAYLEAIENQRAFLERYSFLFQSESKRFTATT